MNIHSFPSTRSTTQQPRFRHPLDGKINHKVH